jgi:glycosyltransferase involved in cell wall biosynthesis
MLELIPAFLYGILTLISIFFTCKLIFAFKHFRMKKLLSEPSLLHDLPSVSVCIPARNETAAMTQCLERVIASTYPKLEIIVLDDSSADNTPHLIKAFAHSGVRFVEGEPLTEGWLGKNHALQGLLDEASGSLVLFMDVDTHIKPDTIEQLVSYMRQQKISMISALPLREDGWRFSVLLGTMRFFWTLIFSSRNKPAVASTAWMIDRTVIKDEFDGFDHMKGAIQPESIIASKLSKEKRYNFLIGTPLLGISYEKKWSSQVDTSIRLLYPIIGGRQLNAIIAVLLLLILNIPTIFIVDGLVTGWTITHIIALWQTCLFIAIYARYVGAVWKRGWWLGALLWPYIVGQELVLLIISTHRYMSRSVNWKGRPITVSLRAR